MLPLENNPLHSSILPNRIRREWLNFWILDRRTMLVKAPNQGRVSTDEGSTPEKTKDRKDQNQNGILVLDLNLTINMLWKRSIGKFYFFLNLILYFYFSALTELGFQWKNISYFKIRVRMANKNNPERFDKMNITLYKVTR